MVIINGFIHKIKGGSTPEWWDQLVRNMLLLEKCEKEALELGFSSFELLVATLSGEKLYSRYGYIPKKTVDMDLGNGIK